MLNSSKFKGFTWLRKNLDLGDPYPIGPEHKYVTCPRVTQLVHPKPFLWVRCMPTSMDEVLMCTALWHVEIPLWASLSSALLLLDRFFSEFVACYSTFSLLSTRDYRTHLPKATSTWILYVTFATSYQFVLAKEFPPEDGKTIAQVLRPASFIWDHRTTVICLRFLPRSSAHMGPPISSPTSSLYP